MTIDLFAPIARSSDPATSHEAAAKKTNSGSRTSDADLLFAAILENPDHTTGELAQLLIASGLNWYRAGQIASKRISDLASEGAIRETGRRKCEITGHKARTWIAI